MNCCADKLAVADLVHRYAQHIRRGQPMACAELLADDIAFTIAEREIGDDDDAALLRTSLNGKAEVLSYIGRAGGSLRIVPIIHNLVVEVAGETARGNCLMQSVTSPAGYEVFGEYTDEFRRLDTGWVFTRRSFVQFRGIERGIIRPIETRP